MKKLTSEQRQTIKIAREMTLNNAWQLLQNAVHLFEKKQYAVACFLAMTAIEESGKLFVLQLVQGDLLKIIHGYTYVPQPDPQQLQHFLRNHLDKAIQAAAVSLYINTGADRRHGTNPKSGVHRTSGIILLARSGRWMDIRNACIYTDLDVTMNLASSPREVITSEHAYYFICMAFEILAEQSTSGFGNSFENGDPETIKFWQELVANMKELVAGQATDANIYEILQKALQNYPGNKSVGMSTSMKFQQERLNDLANFMKRWAGTVDIDKLEFLSNPEPLRKEAERREGYIDTDSTE